MRHEARVTQGSSDETSGDALEYLCDTLANMSASDDKIIIRKTILALQSQIADLDIEIDEEGSGNSATLQSVEEILQDAIKRLEVELERLV
jgi:hypothetical protein